jgi:hypothetical protein
MSIRRTAALTFVVTLVATTADAQDIETQRKALYREGTAAADEGQWSAAAEKFRAVIALRSAPKALIALGIAEEHLGQLAEAKRNYEKAEADARSERLADDEQAATHALVTLTPRVPQLAVHVPHPERVRELLLDERTIPSRDAEYSVDPGTHTIVGRGESEFRKIVTLKEGEHGNVSVDVAPLQALQEPMPRPTPESRARGGLPIGPIVLGAVGLVGVGVASGLWAVGVGQDNDVKAQCGGGTTNCPLSAKPEADSASTNIIAGDVIFGIGAALAVAGAAWFIVSSLNHGHSSTIAWASPTRFGIIGRW